MDDRWRDEFLGILARLEANSEQRDTALAVLRAVVGEPISARYVPLKVAAVGFHRETLRQWARDGKIVAIRDGGRWLIDLISLRQYLEHRAVR